MVGNAKRVAGHMTSESVIKSHHPSMYALMQDELQHREILRLREEFLYSDKYMDRLLQDIYGDKHKTLLPKLVRLIFHFPVCGQESFPAKKPTAYNVRSSSMGSISKTLSSVSKHDDLLEGTIQIYG